MPADDLVTFLRLAPEFGGTRFGPFDGLEVRLGSNAERCHIVLPESLGVRAEHAKIIRQGPQNLILAPSERSASVFLWKSGDRRPTQLNTPTAVRAGDSFSLVTADGPRFIVEIDELPEELRAQRDARRGVATGRKRLSAESMGTEVKRQAWTRLLVMGPAQLVQRAGVYIKSGAIYQPRNIIMFLTIASGWIFGGVTACRMVSFKGRLGVASSQVESCKQELAFASDISGESEELSFPQLTARITGVTKVGQTLEEDDELRTQVKKKATAVFSDAKAYRWLVGGKGRHASNFADWRERLLEDDGFDTDTARLMVWVAAERKKAPSTEWTELFDSEGDQVCGLGVAGLTYRQAVHLGIAAQPDARGAGDYNSMSKPEREELLSATVAKASRPFPEGQIETRWEPLAQGGAACLVIEGDDKRTSVPQVLRALAKQLGPEADHVPGTEIAYSPTSRVAKFFAADMTLSDYTGKDGGADFADSYVGVVLDRYDQRGSWVLERTAETIAKGMVLPCLAVLQGEKDKVKEVFGAEMPSAVNCLVLDWRLRNEE